METIEQTLDNWLEEYSANKNLRYRLTAASKENPEGIIPDTAMIVLSKREIKVLAKGLDIVLQSNKESIMDCSYNIVQARKNRNNAEQIIEDNTYLEQMNNTLEEVIQEKEKTIIINTTEKFDKYLESISKLLKNDIVVTFNTSLNPVKDKIFLICLIKDITGISLNEAKEVFNNKDIEERPFTLSIKRYLDNANRLRDYITCNGTIKIKYHYENNCYHSNQNSNTH